MDFRKIFVLKIALVIFASCSEEYDIAKTQSETTVIESLSDFVDPSTPKDIQPFKTLNTETRTASPPQSQYWDIIFSDEFDDNSINTLKWTEVVSDRGTSYVPWSWSPSNIWENTSGDLVIRCRDDGDGTFSTGCLQSYNKFDFKYGYIECRMKLPDKDKGHQGAFWLQTYPGVGQVGNEANDGAEIDIMEAPKKTDNYKVTIHWDGYGSEHKSNGSWVNAQGIHSGYHVFGCEWSPAYLKFYYDGQLVWTETNVDHISDVAEFIRLSVGILNWCDGDVRNGGLPTYTKFDWVRVYKKRHPIPGDAFVLKSKVTDKYVYASGSDPDIFLKATSDGGGSWYKFRITDSSNPWVKFLSKRNLKYVYANNYKNRLKVAGDGGGSWSDFQFEKISNGVVRIKSRKTDKYLWVDVDGDNSYLHSTGNGTGEAAEFEWSEVQW